MASELLVIMGPYHEPTPYPQEIVESPGRRNSNGQLRTSASHEGLYFKTSMTTEQEISLLAGLREQVERNITLLNLTSPVCLAHLHNAWVWDASNLPSESHYVPVYLDIIDSLQRTGLIAADRHILVETTTGNAGAAAAYVAKAMGYSIVVLMPADMPATRIADVRQYLSSPESQLMLTTSGGYVRGMVSELRRFLIDHRSGLFGKELLPLNHSRRVESVGAMYKIGRTLMSRIPTGEKLDYAVLALGNGTTTTGLGKAIKEAFPSVKIIGVEPFEAPWCYAQKWPGRFRETYGFEPGYHTHGLIGTGAWGVRFPNLDLGLLDDIVLVGEEEWHQKLAELTQVGLAVGHSSAACLAVLDKISATHSGERLGFFSVIYDRLSKY